MHKISVLMCNYNYGDFVGQAIESVLSQTLPDFEFIIVDDGSTDHSVSEISRFNDHRIKLIFKENGGQASAFNVGIRHCTGDLISFLDSDDWWLPQKLETVLCTMQASKAQIGVVQHQLTVWCEGQEWPYKRILPTGDCFAEMKATGRLDYFVPTSGIAVPANICRKVFPVPESLRVCADAFVTRTSIAFGKLLSIPESLGYYRKHSNTVYMNSEFDDIGLYNAELIPALNQFYRNNGFEGTQLQSVPKRSFRRKALRRIARIFQKLADI